MHYRAKVIFPNEVGHSWVIFLLKLFGFAIRNSVLVDGDIIVPVFSRVFVPEPNSVHQLMDHSAQKIYVKIGQFCLLVKTKS